MNDALHKRPDESILLPLAELDRELTIDENKAVLREIPLLVVADDNDMTRSSIARVLLRPSKSTLSEHKGQITKLFDEIEESDAAPAPIVVCSNSLEAREAICNTIERKIKDGVLLFDDNMGESTGLSLFKEHSDFLPSGMVRILHTGRPPDDMELCLKNGVIDDGIVKPCGIIKNHVVQAFLKRFLANFRQAR